LRRGPTAVCSADLACAETRNQELDGFVGRGRGGFATRPDGRLLRGSAQARDAEPRAVGPRGSANRSTATYTMPRLRRGGRLRHTAERGDEQGTSHGVTGPQKTSGRFAKPRTTYCRLIIIGFPPVMSLAIFSILCTQYHYLSRPGVRFSRFRVGKLAKLGQISVGVVALRARA
jgi:hypothetical protein